MTVMDEGEGIPVELHDRVFTRFWRSGRRGGTGWGSTSSAAWSRRTAATSRSVAHPAAGPGSDFVLPAGTPDFAD